MLQKKKLLFLGAGSMAEAMISGIVKEGLIPPNQITVTNQSNFDRLKQLENRYQITGVKKDELKFTEYDLIFLAMKPKDAQTSLLTISDRLQHHQLIISVLAGVSTQFMEQHLPSEQQVIRVMPNTSSMIGESATGICSGTWTTRKNMNLTIELLKCIGEVYEIQEESMDIFTGLAGSGPAYIYYLMEHMEKEGKSAGLSESLTRQIIAQTISGAAKMVKVATNSPAELRIRVTSPNGTTAAGLEALETFGGGIAISQAVKMATSRSLEITQQLKKDTEKTAIMSTGVMK